MTIALIDYGAGNLHSVHNALKAVGADVAVTADPAVVAGADRIVLPGVGAFGACARGLRGVEGMVEALDHRVRRDGVPFLGICVGMQLLATRGLEFEDVPGLGWIAGEVRLIEPADNTIKVPHMGWNDVAPMGHPGAAELVEPGEAYFLHSYAFHPERGHDIAAMTDHGGGIVAAVAHENILGVQFHPEKSQRYGLDLLSRFLDWNP
ncbi:imidazole glycerol phosphate synthase subunit HisH [Alteriqipengyuania flavescens]|uniref:imidazole glycerol phosphate synthase subunit HisH n=1 Tax=Alteriqipengyuania flavescens TaxID=3053610 RepID=UPI0025B38684|nr:imidazole glycerol phosphate synthase subunit HisH [Alteriqipengyuania flavescens]WJY17745.1 imidazole glycerol phosphate synthase subunit HisH [Alteriqipengyuania flavescens]WJY23688.1 imidazole glycerol phosphate synthase subunit HisH [Alteriqipengyuania flavescens]